MNNEHKTRTRLTCPKCKHFLLEATPPLPPGQKITAYCKRCRLLVDYQVKEKNETEYIQETKGGQ